MPKNRYGAIAKVAPSGHRDPACSSDLPGTGLTSELPHSFDYVVQAIYMPFCHQTTVCVDGQLPPQLNPASHDEVAGLPTRAEAAFFELVQKLEREAVVNHRGVNVARSDAGLGECTRRCLRQETGHWGNSARHEIGVQKRQTSPLPER